MLALLRRDGDRCHYCQVVFSDRARATRDHVVPASRGGTNVQDNLVLACFPCNTGRGCRAYHEFKTAMNDWLAGRAPDPRSALPRIWERTPPDPHPKRQWRHPATTTTCTKCGFAQRTDGPDAHCPDHLPTTINARPGRRPLAGETCIACRLLQFGVQPFDLSARCALHDSDALTA